MRKVWSAAIAATGLVLPGVAHADVWGGDLPLLTGILSEATSTVTQLSSMLKTAKASYEQVKEVAGYAADAADAYKEFSQLNSALWSGDVQGAFDQAFPDLATLRQEASQDLAGGWAQGHGELQRLVSACVERGQCAQAQQALSFQQTRDALATAFGSSPTGDLAAADDEAAVALAGSAAQEGRGEVNRKYAQALMRQCQQGGSKSNLAACQAAAAAAQIAAVQQNADLADEVAQGNRLQALQLELKSEERKKELVEAQQRRDLLLDGAQENAAPPPKLETEGFDALGEVSP